MTEAQTFPGEVTAPEKEALDKYEIALARRAQAKKNAKKANALPGQRLSAPKRDGFERRWANDQGVRLDQLQDKGYTFVEDDGIDTDDTGTRNARKSGSNPEGGALVSYLMEIPEELHREDQQEKEALIRDGERAIHEARSGGKGIGTEEGGKRLYDPNPGNNNFQLE